MLNLWHTLKVSDNTKTWQYAQQEEGNFKPVQLTSAYTHTEEVTSTKSCPRNVNTKNLTWIYYLLVYPTFLNVMKMTRMVAGAASFLSKDIPEGISHSLIYSQVSYWCAVWGNAALMKAAHLTVWSRVSILQCNVTAHTIVEHVRQHSMAPFGKV